MSLRPCIVLALTAFSMSARADSGRAIALFDQGRALIKAGDYENACKKFSAAFDLDHRPGIELNLADCHEHLGHLRTAVQLFEDAAKLFEQGHETERADYARKRARTTAERLGTIHIVMPDPDGIALRIDGRSIDAAREVSELVEPGDITVTADGPGGTHLERHASVASGATATIDLGVEETAPVPVAVVATAPPPPSRTRVHLAMGFGAGAIATAAGALAFGFVARSRYDAAAQDTAHCDPGDPPHCDPIGAQRIDHAHDLAAVGTGLAITSGALAITAIVLYVTAPKDLVIAPSANGVAVLGRF